MPSTALSVILPNYNGRQLLQRNLPSLFTALKGLEHEVIVVDDCSGDDSVSFLQQHYPQITLIQNPHNLGFSATCNAGIKAATKALSHKPPVRRSSNKKSNNTLIICIIRFVR